LSERPARREDPRGRLDFDFRRIATIFRFANGRMAETWGVVDVFSQMQQLGVI
jgi:hypothetical protein